MATADGAWCRGESILAEQDGSDMTVAAFTRETYCTRIVETFCGPTTWKL